MHNTQTIKILITRKTTQPTAIITIVHVVQTTSPSSNSPRTKTVKEISVSASVSLSYFIIGVRLFKFYDFFVGDKKGIEEIRGLE